MDKKTINAIIALIISGLIIYAIFWTADLDSSKSESRERESIFSFSLEKKPINNETQKQEPETQTESKEISISDSIKKVITGSILEANIAEPVKQEPEVAPQIEIKPEIKTQEVKALSEEEIFNKLWPNYYRDHLTEIQNYLLDENLITKTSDFTSQDQIYSFFSLYLEKYKTLANLSDEEFNNLENKITNTKNIKQTQKQAIIGDVSFLKIFNKLINTAHASYVTGAFWYKDDAPGNIAPGVSSPNTCGNCGIEIRSGTNRFHQNCQAYGVLCDIQLGCLNGTCRAFPNAIWDEPTTMCGCG